MEPAPVGPGTRRPGGRTSRTRAAAVSAVLAELVDHGYRGLSVEGVALRSGVHKTTLYRRWGSVHALLVDAAGAAMDEAVPIPDTGTLRGDLAELATLIGANLRHPITQALIRLVAAEGDRQPWLAQASARFWLHRGRLTQVVVDRAVGRNELPVGSDSRELLETLIAPLYLRLLVTGRPLDDTATRAAAEVAAAAAENRLLVPPMTVGP